MTIRFGSFGVMVAGTTCHVNGGNIVPEAIIQEWFSLLIKFGVYLRAKHLSILHRSCLGYLHLHLRTRAYVSVRREWLGVFAEKLCD